MVPAGTGWLGHRRSGRMPATSPAPPSRSAEITRQSIRSRSTGNREGPCQNRPSPFRRATSAREPPPVIETRDIRVDYGDFTAVRDLSMSIGPGEIHGLIGPNGAGKTSLIRVLATLLEPTYGEARIAGLDTVEDRAE